MIKEVALQLERIPFVPFAIRTSDGHEYRIPTVDHAWITPRGNTVAVEADDGGVALLGPLHISSVIKSPELSNEADH
jgi:hypothetical protein